MDYFSSIRTAILLEALGMICLDSGKVIWFGSTRQRPMSAGD